MIEELLYELGDELNKVLLEEVYPSLPDVLYHYTNADAAISILQNKSIWASDARFMNDSSELEHAKSLALNTIELTKANLLNGRDLDGEYLDRIIASLPKYNPEQVFVSCFSSKPNILSQWRNYAQDGEGYCIGFDSKILIRSLSEQYLNHVSTLTPVLYEEAPFSLTFSKIINTSLKLFREKVNETSRYGNHIGLWASLICPHIVQMFPKVKHEAFYEEFEWRATCSPLSGTAKLTGKEYLQFRSGRYGITPYIEFKLENHIYDGLIKEIHIGPTAKKDISKYAMESLLQVAGYKNIEIIASELPLR
jgi:hypothetical protein